MEERAPWAPRRFEVEQRRIDCQLRYDLEMESRKVGRDDPALMHDEEKDQFGSDLVLLRKRGRIKGF